MDCLAILLILLLAVLIVFISSYLWKMRREIYLISRLPGPSLLSLIRISVAAGTKDYNEQFFVFLKMFKEYGPIISGWYGFIPLAMLTDPQNIEKVSIHDRLCKRGPKIITEKMMVPFFKSGVLAIEGETWRQHRKILNHAFRISTLQTFVENFVKNSNILSARLMELADGSFHRLDILFTQCTMDIVIQTSLDTDMEIQKRNDVDVVLNTLHVIELQVRRMLSPWLMLDCIFKRTEAYKRQQSVISFLHGIIRDKNRERYEWFKTLEANGEDLDEFLQKHGTLIDTLLLSKELNEDDVVGEITCVAGAGAETSSTVCCYALAILCDHQDIQRKVIEEQLSVFGNDFLRPVTNEDLTSMTYLEQVLKETLRLFPPVPLQYRTTIEEVDIGNGHIIPKGTFVVIMSYVTHRNPDYFPDPDRFDPERFSPDNCIGRHPYAYIPFGLGRRMCVGYNFAMMEMKTILSTVIRRYHFHEVKGGVAGIISSLQLGLVLKPKSDFYFKFSPRSNTMVSNARAENFIE